jgi:hypothetical protein
VILDGFLLEQGNRRRNRIEGKTKIRRTLWRKRDAVESGRAPIPAGPARTGENSHAGKREGHESSVVAVTTTRINDGTERACGGTAAYRRIRRGGGRRRHLMGWGRRERLGLLRWRPSSRRGKGWGW